MGFSLKEKIKKIKPTKGNGVSGVKSVRLAGKMFKPSKGEKFVLFVGDEGAILIHMIGSAVQSRQFVSDSSFQSLGELRQILARSPDAPIYVVIDSMDQSYIQQTLPPVSSLSVGKLVKKRLEREFGTSDIKGAIMLGRESSGRKDWNFMMIAVERSPQITAWLNFVEELPNYFHGIYLVAVEAENILKYVNYASAVPRGASKAQWQFFVSHNKVGGFRQVILHKNRVVFTRLAQPIGEFSTEMVAGNIEQEMLSTIEYMKRLAYNPQEGLEIYILASSGVKNVIDPNKFPNAVLHIFTPYDVAQMLQIEGATQPTDQFGDVILAAIIGCSRSHVLSLTTTHSKKVQQYQQLITLQRVAAGVVSLGMACYAVAMGIGMFSMSQDASEMQESITKQKARIATLREELSRSDLDIEKANDLLELYQLMLREKASPLPTVETFQPIKSAPVWVNKMHWQLVEDGKNPHFLSAIGDSQMSSSVTMEFLDVLADPKAFKAVSQKVLNDVASWFPQYTVSYTALPQSYSENNQLQINFEEDTAKSKEELIAAGPPVAELTVKGPLLKEPIAQVKKEAAAQ